MKERIQSEKRGRQLFFLIVLLQLLLCLWMGYNKRSFFCDEIYSYGLANSEDYTFLDYQSSKVYGANTGGVGRF